MTTTWWKRYEYLISFCESSSLPRISIASNMRGFSLNAGADEDELFDDGDLLIPPAIIQNAPSSNASLSYLETNGNKRIEYDWFSISQ